jgi:hypothetical protein
LDLSLGNWCFLLSSNGWLCGWGVILFTAFNWSLNLTLRSWFSSNNWGGFLYGSFNNNFRWGFFFRWFFYWGLYNSLDWSDFLLLDNLRHSSFFKRYKLIFKIFYLFSRKKKRFIKKRTFLLVPTLKFLI